MPYRHTIKVDILSSAPSGSPLYSTLDSAGMDLRASCAYPITIPPNATVEIPLGFAMELPSGYAMLILSRSGLGVKGINVANGVGLVDADYRGIVKVFLRNTSGQDFIVNNGDRIAQGVIIGLPLVHVRNVDKLSPTKRGEGGFGSTGIS